MFFVRYTRRRSGLRPASHSISARNYFERECVYRTSSCHLFSFKAYTCSLTLIGLNFRSARQSVRFEFFSICSLHHLRAAALVRKSMGRVGSSGKGLYFSTLQMLPNRIGYSSKLEVNLTPQNVLLHSRVSLRAFFMLLPDKRFRGWESK